MKKNYVEVSGKHAINYFRECRMVTDELVKLADHSQADSHFYIDTLNDKYNILCTVDDHVIELKKRGSGYFHVIIDESDVTATGRQPEMCAVLNRFFCRLFKPETHDVDF